MLEKGVATNDHTSSTVGITMAATATLPMSTAVIPVLSPRTSTLAVRMYIDFVTKLEVHRMDTNQKIGVSVITKEGTLLHRSAQPTMVDNGTSAKFHTTFTTKLRIAYGIHPFKSADLCS